MVVAASSSSLASPVNVTERIKVMMNDILMRCTIGDTYLMRDEHIQLLDEGLWFIAGFNLIDLFLLSAREVHDRVHHMMQAIMQDHESKRGDNDRGSDILDVLLRLK
jgi:hypothetical protein